MCRKNRGCMYGWRMLGVTDWSHLCLWPSPCTNLGTPPWSGLCSPQVHGARQDTDILNGCASITVLIFEAQISHLSNNMCAGNQVVTSSKVDEESHLPLRDRLQCNSDPCPSA
jgi:hypothetical protein